MVLASWLQLNLGKSRESLDVDAPEQYAEECRVGSVDDWREQRPGVLYCRHDQESGRW